MKLPMIITWHVSDWPITDHRVARCKGKPLTIEIWQHLCGHM